MDRNFILAIAVSMLILIGWDMLILAPQREAAEATRQATAERTAISEQEQNPLAGIDEEFSFTEEVTVEDALAKAPGRVKIDTPALEGSINLMGARLDDLKLKNYRETIEDDSPIVTMLTPSQTEYGHYLQTGIMTQAGRGDADVWSAEDGAVLTTETPVTLTRETDNIVHTMTISVDEDYMFRVDQSVANKGNTDLRLKPYGVTVQRGMPPFLKRFMILHEGPVGVLGTTLHERKYTNVYKKKKIQEDDVVGGWVGLTSKNWLAALIPNQSTPYKAELWHEPGTTKDNPVFRSLYVGNTVSVAPGETYKSTSHMFAGAKRVELLRQYQASPEDGGLGIVDFDKAVDWGNFFFLTRPIFWLLHFFAGLTGNYGVAILLLTIVVKAFLFPLANKSYASMANMRNVAPEMTKIRERYKDDSMKQQQEMMALYKKHNINPVAGCLPMLIQMPVFYALYKMLFVTIETRHEPFLYISDLSAADPAMLFNLFGLLPYDPSAIPLLGTILGIGLLPLLMGATMWVQMKLSPPPTDPIQAQVFAFMPLVFMFIMSPFAAGLVLYWFWNTFLGVLQQYFIMKRHGTDVDLIGNIKQTFSKSKPAASNDNKGSLFGIPAASDQTKSDKDSK